MLLDDGKRSVKHVQREINERCSKWISVLWNRWRACSYTLALWDSVYITQNKEQQVHRAIWETHIRMVYISFQNKASVNALCVIIRVLFFVYFIWQSFNIPPVDDDDVVCTINRLKSDHFTWENKDGVHYYSIYKIAY